VRFLDRFNFGGKSLTGTEKSATFFIVFIPKCRKSWKQKYFD